jgi:predicted transcriptional regulator
MAKQPRRIARDRWLTPEQAAKYRRARDQVAAELPELVARHHARMREIREVLQVLRDERTRQGLSLADIRDRAGIELSAISTLENGTSPNPTINTLVRYASALGKRIVVRLEDVNQ